MRLFHATGQYKRDYKKAMKQRRPLERLDEAIQILLAGKPLETKLRDHPLVGNYKGCRECHISPDWLLIYRVDGNNFIAERLGTHSELFD